MHRLMVDSQYHLSRLLASSPAVLTGLLGLAKSFPPPLCFSPILFWWAAGLIPFGGPTFIVLNLLIHTSPLPSFSLLSSPSIGSSDSLVFLGQPASLIWHDSFWLKHLMHTLRGCPPLVWGRHVWPRARHWLHGTVLASAKTTTLAPFGTCAHLIFEGLPWLSSVSVWAWVPHLPHSLSPSSSAVISSSLGLSPLPWLALITT